jgi:hypothetical protein
LRRDVVVDATGPAWFRALLEPTAMVGDARMAERHGVPLVVLDVDRTEPFVQPMLSNPLDRAWPEELPPAYERLAREASYGPVDGEKDRHVAYRAAHRRTASTVIEHHLLDTGQPVDSSDRAVTVVCVTNRPQNLDAVLEHYSCQTWEHKRLLVVTNADGFDRGAVDDLVGASGGATIHSEPTVSLGACLNLALDRATTRFVAKIDDDDLYGPSFIEDLMIAHRYAGAGVVGKHSYFAYLSGSDRTVLRFPGGDFRYTPYVAGGTLAIDRERTRSLRFPDVSVGEDQGFVLGCLRRGISTFSADRFNYVQVRGSDNTWQATEDEYLTSYADVGPGAPQDVAIV